jgi:hypothetical protein
MDRLRNRNNSSRKIIGHSAKVNGRDVNDMSQLERDLAILNFEI